MAAAANVPRSSGCHRNRRAPERRPASRDLSSSLLATSSIHVLGVAPVRAICCRTGLSRASTRASASGWRFAAKSEPAAGERDGDVTAAARDAAPCASARARSAAVAAVIG